MTQLRSPLLTLAATVASLFCGADRPAQAGILFLQPYDGVSNAGIAQVFPDVPDFSTKLFDDFLITSTGGWNITGVTLIGKETGNPDRNQAISLSFTPIPEFFPPPPPPQSVVLNFYPPFHGQGQEINGDLVFKNLNVHLPPGQWWVSGWVTRPLDPGGQWFWRRTTLGNQNVDDLEHWFQNPGNGFMLGSEPQEGHVLFGDVRDLSFEIDGTVAPSLVPEPASLLLFGLGLTSWLAFSCGRRSLKSSRTASM